MTTSRTNAITVGIPKLVILGRAQPPGRVLTTGWFHSKTIDELRSLTGGPLYQVIELALWQFVRTQGAACQPSSTRGSKSRPKLYTYGDGQKDRRSVPMRLSKGLVERVMSLVVGHRYEALQVAVEHFIEHLKKLPGQFVVQTLEVGPHTRVAVDAVHATARKQSIPKSAASSTAHIEVPASLLKTLMLRPRERLVDVAVAALSAEAARRKCMATLNARRLRSAA